MSSFTYPIRNFPTVRVDVPRFKLEIQASSIVVAFDSVVVEPSVSCTITFKADLSNAEQATLDDLVAHHSGDPLPVEVQQVSLNGVPLSSDGKPQMTPNLLPSWTSLYFTGQGDDREDGVGAGQAFTCTSDVEEDQVIEWIFTDQIFLVGGSALFEGAQLGDTLDYAVVAPATPTGVGMTAVAKIPYGPGNVLVPNPAGADTIDLSDCGLVPTPGTGYWDWDEPSQGWGTITPNYEGKGGYTLFDFEVPLGHPLVKLHLMGAGKLDFLMTNITPMRVLPSWLHRATIHNCRHIGLKLVWMFIGGRGGAI